MVWETDFGSGVANGGAIEFEEEQENVGTESLPDNENDYVRRKIKKDKYDRPLPASKKEDAPASNDIMGFFQVEKIEGGDEFLAIKPWLGAIKEPSDWKKPPLNQNKPPKAELILEHVHGYRAKYCF